MRLLPTKPFSHRRCLVADPPATLRRTIRGRRHASLFIEGLCAPRWLRRGHLAGGVGQMSAICSHADSIELTELPTSSPDAGTASRSGEHGCTCACASLAATSHAATARRTGTPRPTPTARGTRLPIPMNPGRTGAGAGAWASRAGGHPGRGRGSGRPGGGEHPTAGLPGGARAAAGRPIAGDDPAAKAAVTGFLDAIGYDTVDAGTLGSGGRRFQFGTRAFVAPYGGLSDQRGTPAGVAAIRAALGT